MSMTKAEAAQVLGAKESEVRRVRGDLVTTTDGTTVRIADGAVAAIVDPAPGYQGPLPIERTPVEDDDDETPAEEAPKRSGRRPKAAAAEATSEATPEDADS